MPQRVYPSRYDSGALLIAAAVTPIHAGAGRGYGVVDLPIQRDAMGYPEIWASSIKGALKTYLLRIFSNDDNMLKAVRGFFGSEPEETPTVPGLAMLHNLVPLAVPVPSITHGFLYVTTPYLLARIKSYIEIVETYPANHSLASGKLYDEVKQIVEEAFQLITRLKDDKAATLSNLGDKVALGTMELEVSKHQSISSTNKASNQKSTKLDDLHPLYQVRKIREHLVIVDDKLGKTLIEFAIQRVYRVRLERGTKTVERGALWSEEYLPQGTLLIGLMVWQNPAEIIELIKKQAERKGGRESKEYSQFIDPYKSLKSNLWKLLNLLNQKYIIVGGKETIGRGILKLSIASSSTTNTTNRGKG